MTAPEPVFLEPWHAQVFSLTVHLHDRGCFTWPDWAARFGATLKAHGLTRELDGGDDYFHAWLATLEAVLAEDGAAAPEDAARVAAQWRNAYLGTPHGQSVTLD